MKLMRTLQIAEKEHAEIVHLPIPVPERGQILVKVTGVTTCPQWDLHIYHGKPMFNRQSFVPLPYPSGQSGHEMTGTIAELGEDCEPFKIGQTASAWKDPGQTKPGCYAEYVIIDKPLLIQVPKHLHYIQVASMELAMCVASSILKLKSAIGIKGKKCAVNGLGPAGLIALQMLMAEGADQVIGIDPNAERRILGASLGLTAAYDPKTTEIPLRQLEGACELAVDCVGYPDVTKFIMDHTNEAVALFAVQREDYILHHPGLTIIGYPGHHREAAEYALELVVKNKLRLEPLVSKEMAFEDYAHAIEVLKNQQAIKICFVPALSADRVVLADRENKEAIH